MRNVKCNMYIFWIVLVITKLLLKFRIIVHGYKLYRVTLPFIKEQISIEVKNVSLHDNMLELQALLCKRFAHHRCSFCSGVGVCESFIQIFLFAQEHFRKLLSGKSVSYQSMLSQNNKSRLMKIGKMMDLRREMPIQLHSNLDLLIQSSIHLGNRFTTRSPMHNNRGFRCW